MRIPWFIPVIIGVILGGATAASWITWVGLVMGFIMLWHESEA